MNETLKDHRNYDTKRIISEWNVSSIWVQLKRHFGEQWGATGSDVTRSDMTGSHVTGSDASHVTGRGPVRKCPRPEVGCAISPYDTKRIISEWNVSSIWVQLKRHFRSHNGDIAQPTSGLGHFRTGPLPVTWLASSYCLRIFHVFTLWFLF
jgi:hypothetical protein